ncbi:MAG: sugar phosphate isomerase/epimerase [bacterium]|nr:sugar phosphate isomerase/epimerase [bacterium]
MTTLFQRWRTILSRSFGALAIVAGLITNPMTPQPRRALLVYDFDLGPVPASNVDHVRSLGFDGLVTRCSVASDIPKLTQYANHVASLSRFQMLAYVNYDFNHPDSPTVWRDALPILAALDAPLWVIVKNAASTAEVDDLLLRMARGSAAFGVPMVIYPHWNTNIENAAEAAIRIAQVGHANIHTSLHTCHEIRSGNQYDLRTVVATHVQNTRLVTIAGADSNAYAGPPPHTWSDAIRPLDRGGFDLTPFLHALRKSRYKGPVILHTWGLANDPGHLARSIRTYAKY